MDPIPHQTTAAGSTIVHQGLSSLKSAQRLDEIARLRARGVGEHISLPQLVVCGDQSTGKSSTLEGITGFPFPREEGLCTRFATEIILTHTDYEYFISAEIIPAPHRDVEIKEVLLKFKRDIDDFSQLSGVIQEAGSLMGVRGFGGAKTGQSFAEDVLRIKVSGPTGVHLTVVDLPGLIAVSNEEQSDADVEAVHRLVDSYVENRRTIILAVVQAGNDIANQGIIQKSKRYDRLGERTIGIITKPDLINKGTESRIAALARNEDSTKLKLGFFLLRNPSPSDLVDGQTQQNRESAERAYFTASPWKELGLDPERTGIAPLRDFLQRLLERHIEKELPKVREELSSLIVKLEEDVSKLGEARPTPGHLRVFLSRIAMHYHRLATAALHGDYHGVDAAFFDFLDHSNESLRLRAMVHNLNTAFSDFMRTSGQTMKVNGSVDPAAAFDDTASDNEHVENDALSIEIAVPNVDWTRFSGPGRPYEHLISEQSHVSQKKMKAFVMKLYRNTRGRELPGNYNHVLLAELFHYQSKGWKHIASRHVSEVYLKVKHFITEAVRYVVVDDQVSAEMLDRMLITLDESKRAADEELENLWSDIAQQPITYNHYYTDNIEKARRQVARDWVRKAIQETSTEAFNGTLHISNTSYDKDRLLRSLQGKVTVDMDEQACSEVLDGFSAYYKVARKTFVDNVCIQVVERHILRSLPDLFSPEQVAAFSEEDMEQIAGEQHETIVKRKRLQDLHESLSAALRDLRK